MNERKPDVADAAAVADADDSRGIRRAIRSTIAS
jgi:hypothetical protein